MAVTSRLIAAPAVRVNNITVTIVPNSLKYTEGLGEQKMKVASAGGNGVRVIYADDVSTKLSKVSFEIYTVSVDIENVKSWKLNQDNNVIHIVDPASNFTRTFMKAALLTDYEVVTGADGQLSLEWMSYPAS